MEVTIRKLLPLARSETIEHQSTTAPRDETAYLGFSGGAQALVEAYRLHGYCQASINPLDRRPFDASLIAELDPGVYGLALDESVSYLIHFGGASHTLSLSELLGRLQAIYCGSISLESAHIRAT